MRAAFAALLFLGLGVVAGCDQLNKPMAVPNGNIGPVGGTSSTSSGGPAITDAGSSDALPPLPPGPGPQPAVVPQPGDTQL